MNKTIFRQDVNYVLSLSLSLLCRRSSSHSILPSAPLATFILTTPVVVVVVVGRETSLPMQMRSFGIRRPLPLLLSKLTGRDPKSGGAPTYPAHKQSSERLSLGLSKKLDQRSVNVRDFTLFIIAEVRLILSTKIRIRNQNLGSYIRGPYKRDLLYCVSLGKLPHSPS